MESLLTIIGAISATCIVLMLCYAVYAYVDIYRYRQFVANYFEHTIEAKLSPHYLEQLTVSFMRGEDLGLTEPITPAEAKDMVAENKRLKSQIQEMRRVVDYRYELKLSDLERKYSILKGQFKKLFPDKVEIAISMAETTGLSIRPAQYTPVAHDHIRVRSQRIGDEGVDISDMVSQTLRANSVRAEKIDASTFNPQKI